MAVFDGARVVRRESRATDAEGGPACLCGARGCFEHGRCGLWLEPCYGKPAKAGDRLFIPLRTELRRQITNWSAARIDVVPAALGDDSVLYGALAGEGGCRFRPRG